ncbi:zinc finger protein 33B-like [Apis florea]|uniref:zinc finger protein 33B-like n=1 Tax=Apis florea TaxID=7463 RepID=UPI0012FF3D46|nr:zinc finger protein 33B-like [Apis florea]
MLLRETLQAPVLVDDKGLYHVKDARLGFQNLPNQASIYNQKKHVCNCGKVYSQKSSLDRHLRYECGKTPNVPCPQCGKMFKHRHHVTQHLAKSMWQQLAHNRQRSRTRQGKENAKQCNETRFFCESCGKSYKWKESLLKHKRVECGKLPQFSCEVCGYRFMHKHHLVKHMAAIHRMSPLSGAAITSSSSGKFKCLYENSVAMETMFDPQALEESDCSKIGLFLGRSREVED